MTLARENQLESRIEHSTSINNSPKAISIQPPHDSEQILSEESSEFSCISWNIEGFQANVNNLAHFANFHSPSFIFLSEPQIFQHGLGLAMMPLQHNYSYSLNSDDLHDPDLGLSSAKTHGGTMIL